MEEQNGTSPLSLFINRNRSVDDKNPNILEEAIDSYSAAKTPEERQSAYRNLLRLGIAQPNPSKGFWSQGIDSFKKGLVETTGDIGYSLGIDNQWAKDVLEEHPDWNVASDADALTSWGDIAGSATASSVPTFIVGGISTILGAPGFITVGAQYLTTFAQEYGRTKQEYLEKGFNESDANAYAGLEALVNSGIELMPWSAAGKARKLFTGMKTVERNTARKAITAAVAERYKQMYGPNWKRFVEKTLAEMVQTGAGEAGEESLQYAWSKAVQGMSGQETDFDAGEMLKNAGAGFLGGLTLGVPFAPLNARYNSQTGTRRIRGQENYVSSMEKEGVPVNAGIQQGKRRTGKYGFETPGKPGGDGKMSDERANEIYQGLLAEAQVGEEGITDDGVYWKKTAEDGGIVSDDGNDINDYNQREFDRIRGESGIETVDRKGLLHQRLNDGTEVTGRSVKELKENAMRHVLDLVHADAGPSESGKVDGIDYVKDGGKVSVSTRLRDGGATFGFRVEDGKLYRTFENGGRKRESSGEAYENRVSAQRKSEFDVSGVPEGFVGFKGGKYFKVGKDGEVAVLGDGVELSDELKKVYGSKETDGSFVDEDGNTFYFHKNGDTMVWTGDKSSYDNAPWNGGKKQRSEPEPGLDKEKTLSKVNRHFKYDADAEASREVSGYMREDLGGVQTPENIKVYNPKSKAMKALADVGDKIGIRVRFFSDVTFGGTADNYNGIFGRPGEVWVNVNRSVDSPMNVLGHEWGHNLRRRSPQLYQQLKDTMFQYLKDNKDAELERLADRYGREANSNYISEEFLCDRLGDVFGDVRFWERYANQTRENGGIKALRELKRILSDFITAVKNAFKGFEKNESASRFISDLDKVFDAVSTAIEEHAEVLEGARKMEESSAIGEEQFADEVRESEKSRRQYEREEWNRVAARDRDTASAIGEERAAMDQAESAAADEQYSTEEALRRENARLREELRQRNLENARNVGDDQAEYEDIERQRDERQFAEDEEQRRTDDEMLAREEQRYRDGVDAMRRKAKAERERRISERERRKRDTEEEEQRRDDAAATEREEQRYREGVRALGERSRMEGDRERDAGQRDREGMLYQRELEDETNRQLEDQAQAEAEAERSRDAAQREAEELRGWKSEKPKATPQKSEKLEDIYRNMIESKHVNVKKIEDVLKKEKVKWNIDALSRMGIVVPAAGSLPSFGKTDMFKALESSKRVDPNGLQQNDRFNNIHVHGGKAYSLSKSTCLITTTDIADGAYTTYGWRLGDEKEKPAFFEALDELYSDDVTKKIAITPDDLRRIKVLADIGEEYFHVPAAFIEIDGRFIDARLAYRMLKSMVGLQSNLNNLFFAYGKRMPVAFVLGDNIGILSPVKLQESEKSTATRIRFAEDSNGVLRIASRDGKVQDEGEPVKKKARAKKEKADESRASLAFARLSGDLSEAVRQKFGSAGTSLRQVASGFRKIGFEPGTVNLDLGGGKFDEATEYLDGLGVRNLVFDPFNRTTEHNRKIYDEIRNGGVDTVTCNNVLNVIAEPAARSNVILQAAKALKPGGTAYFTVYEGDGSGNAHQSKSDSWQEFRKTGSYIGEVSEHFDDVSMKGKVIVARGPNVDGKESVWQMDGEGNDSARFSLADIDEPRYLMAGEIGAKNLSQSSIDNEFLRNSENNRIKAEIALDFGEDPKTVKFAYGWEKRKDGWKEYVPDGKIKTGTFAETGGYLNGVGPIFLTCKLDDIYDAPEIFAAYPELKKKKVYFVYTQGSRAAFYYVPYNPVDSFFLFSTYKGDFYSRRNGAFTLRQSETLLKSIVHETQHYVQRVEGFFTGGSPKNATAYRTSATLDISDKMGKLKAQREKLILDGIGEDSEAIKEIDEKLRSLNYYWSHPQTYAYRHFRGEVEARNASSLAGKSIEEANSKLFSETEEYPESEQYDSDLGLGHSFQNYFEVEDNNGNVAKSIDDEPRACLKDLMRATGVRLEINEKERTFVAFDKHGERITEDNRLKGSDIWTEDMMVELKPKAGISDAWRGNMVSTLFYLSPQNFTASDRKSIADTYADIVNQAVKYAGEKGSIDALDAMWKWAGSSVYKVIKPNGDSQYKLSVDMTTICKKTMALVNYISDQQVKLGRGLNPGEVIEAYLKVGESGEQTPCPICYVFSHWFRNGGVLNTTIKAQERWGKEIATASEIKKMSKSELKAYQDKWFGIWQEEKSWVDRNRTKISKMKSDLDIMYLIASELTVDISRMNKEKKQDTPEYENAVVMLRQLSESMRICTDVISHSDFASWIAQNVIKVDSYTEVDKDGNPIKGKKKTKEQLEEEERNREYDENGDLIETPEEKEKKYYASGVWDDFKVVPKRTLLDYMEADLLEREYKNVIRFKKSKGTAAGKTMETDAENAFGDVIAGISSKADSSKFRNNFAIAFDETADFETRKKAFSAIKTQISTARNWEAKQRLRGGQRFFSWSDYLLKFGPDTFSNMVQLQALGTSVQSYSKQLEGVETMALMNAYCNGSLIAYKNGMVPCEKGAKAGWYDRSDRLATDKKKALHYRTDAIEVDGKYYQLDFSRVQGIDAEKLFELNRIYDKAGNIVVGMNDEHIKVAMASDDIFFIIPYHSSSLKFFYLKNMMTMLGENPGNVSDYTKVQEDEYLDNYKSAHKSNLAVDRLWKRTFAESSKYGWKSCIEVKTSPDIVTESQLNYRHLRERIMSGTASKEDIELAKKDEFLSVLWDELHKAGAARERLGGSTRGTVVNGSSENYVQLKMTKDDIKSVSPFEYWDRNSTFETADVNGLRYLEYCRRLGVRPKFCGILNDGKILSHGDFTQNKGYWKILPDRRMYGRDGKYQDTDTVTPSQARIENFVNELVMERHPITKEFKSVNKKTSASITSRLNELADLSGDDDLTDIDKRQRMLERYLEFRDMEQFKSRISKASKDNANPGKAKAVLEEDALPRASLYIRANPIVNDAALRDEVEKTFAKYVFTDAKTNAEARDLATRMIQDLGGFEKFHKALQHGKRLPPGSVGVFALRALENSSYFLTLSKEERDKVIENRHAYLGSIAGQTLQAFRETQFDASTAANVQASVNNYLKTFPDERIRKIQRFIEDKYGVDIKSFPDTIIQDRQKLDAVLRDIITHGDDFWRMLPSRATELWMNFILSGIKTHVVNTASNIGQAIYEFGPKRITEATLNSILGLTGHRIKGGATWGEYKSMLEYVDWKKAWKDAKEAFDLEVLNADLGKMDARFLPKIPGMTGRIVRTPSRLLRAADVLIRGIIAPMETAAYAYRVGRSSGLNGENLREFIRSQFLEGNERSVSQEYGDMRAKEFTFTEDIPGEDRIDKSILNQIYSWKESGGFQGWLVNTLLPFVKTPYNILRQSVRKGHLGALNLAYQTVEAVKGNRKFDDEYLKILAEQVVCWALTGMFYYGFGDDDEPIITGEYEERRGSRGQWERQNIPAQSIRIGKTWYDYSRIEPLSNVLSAIGNVVHARKSDDPKAYMKAFVNTAKAMADKSYLQTARELMDIASADEYTLKNVGANYISSWIPNIARQFLLFSDDKVRETRGAEFFDLVRTRSGERVLCPKVDYFGREIDRDANVTGSAWLWRFAPINSKPADYGDDADELFRNYNFQNPDKAYFPPLASRKYRNRSGENVDMTGEEYHEFSAAAGKLAHKKVLEGIRRGYLNKNRPEEKDIDLIKKIFTRARKETREKMFRGK